MAEENPYPENRVTCYLEKTEGIRPSSNNDPSIYPILQALKDREYDGKFKKGTRIITDQRICPLLTHNIAYYF